MSCNLLLLQTSDRQTSITRFTVDTKTATATEVIRTLWESAVRVYIHTCAAYCQSLLMTGKRILCDLITTSRIIYSCAVLWWSRNRLSHWCLVLPLFFYAISSVFYRHTEWQIIGYRCARKTLDFQANKYVSVCLHCRAEMYAARVACLPCLTRDWRWVCRQDGRTDGLQTVTLL